MIFNNSKIARFHTILTNNEILQFFFRSSYFICHISSLFCSKCLDKHKLKFRSIYQIYHKLRKDLYRIINPIPHSDFRDSKQIFESRKCNYFDCRFKSSNSHTFYPQANTQSVFQHTESKKCGQFQFRQFYTQCCCSFSPPHSNILE